MSPGETILADRVPDLLMLGLRQPKLALLLAKATKEHKQVEDKFAELLSQCTCGQNAQYPNRQLAAAEYLERNFFSILFLSTFTAANIPPHRRIQYGVILHAIRTIVTCADNILDNEQKGAVFLNAGLNNNVLDNVTLSLISQRIICQAVRAVANNQAVADRIEVALLDGICSVGRGEGLANMDELVVMPRPEEIVEKIHKKIGGELLRLALIAPLENEVEQHQALKRVEAGILDIGIALQMMDDVVDIEDDIAASRANLLTSWIVYNDSDGGYSTEQLRQMAAENKTNFKDVFRYSRLEVVNAAIARALDGFTELSHGGYPISSDGAVSVLKFMFGIRGLGPEWQGSDYAEYRNCARYSDK